MGTSAAEMRPSPSLSNTLNASRSSSSESESCEVQKLKVGRGGGEAGLPAEERPVSGQTTFIFFAMRFRNSGKSMVPFPSASTSLIMSCRSASVGF